MNQYAIILAALAAANMAQAGTATFDWSNPEKYADMGSNDSYSESTFQSFKKAMEGYIATIAERYLPQGQSLAFDITDVDLAGEFEPWHRAPYDDVRIVRGIYMPRISFDYRLRDAAGNTLESGHQKLVGRDFEFDIGRRIFAEDEFYYEKDLLGNWIRHHFRAKR